MQSGVVDGCGADASQRTASRDKWQISAEAAAAWDVGHRQMLVRVSLTSGLGRPPSRTKCFILWSLATQQPDLVSDGSVLTHGRTWQAGLSERMGTGALSHGPLSH
jgi:hypothetical protein